MAMADRTRRELSKLRELVWYLLSGRVCYFCKKPLLPVVEGVEIRFGDATGMPLLDLDITEHHIDGDHLNNDPANLDLAHESCHKRHHAKLVFARIRQVRKAMSIVAEQRRAKHPSGMTLDTSGEPFHEEHP